MEREAVADLAVVAASPTIEIAAKKAMEDPRMKPENNPMPFDGKRLIYGGFSPVVTLEK